MLEHPEIAWIERTGYPSWMQEDEMKTADEMFRELGYEKIYENPLTTIYEDVREYRVYLKFPGGRSPKNIMVYATSPTTGGCEMTYGELRAVCKLLDEMGVE